MRFGRSKAMTGTLAMAMMLVACNGATEAETGDAEEAGAAESADAAEASEQEPGEASEQEPGEASEEGEVDASVDPERLVTTITFSGEEYDIRDVRCDDFGGDWQVHGYIDTVHRGGDSITVHDREVMGGVYVELTIRDQETDEEVVWVTDEVDGLEVDADMEGGASGTVEMELSDSSVRDIGERGNETLELDLHCDQAL